MKMAHIRNRILSTLVASLICLCFSMGCTENQQEKGAASHLEQVEQSEASSEVELAVKASAKTVADQDTVKEITFEFEDLGRERGASQVRADGDTVFFEIYYAKSNCREYEYTFRKVGDSLIVLHQDLGIRMKHTRAHAIKGEIHGLRSGNYLFFLKDIYGKYNKAPRVLFQDSLVVK